MIDEQAVVGELIEDTAEYVRILDLRTDEPRTLRKDQAKSVRVGISEQQAALTVGLPAFLAWNIRRATPTKGTNAFAVLPLCDANGQETAEGREFAESLTTELERNDVHVVERRLLDKVLRELSMQNSSGFDPLTAQRIGKQLGAYAVLTGTIVPKGKGYQAELRLLQVETGEVLFTASHAISALKKSPEPAEDQPGPVVVVKPEPAMPKKPERPSNIVVKPVPVPLPDPKLEIKLKWSLEGHVAPVVETIISPDDSIAASSSMDGTVRLWSLETGKCIRVIQPDGGPCDAIAFSLDGSILVSGTADGNARAWEVSSGKLIHVYEVFSSSITAICFKPTRFNTKSFFAGTAKGIFKRLQIPVRTSRQSEGWKNEQGEIACFAFSTGLHAWGGERNLVLAVDKETGTLYRKLMYKDKSESVHCLRFSKDKSTLMSSGLSVPLRLWDVNTAQHLHSINNSEGVRRFDFTPDGSMVIAAKYSGGTIVAFEVSTDKQTLETNAHEPRIWSLDLSSNGRTLVSGGDDKLVKVWDVQYK